jgi:hypothetical protein
MTEKKPGKSAESARKRWADPEVRKAQSEKLKQAWKKRKEQKEANQTSGNP